MKKIALLSLALMTAISCKKEIPNIEDAETKIIETVSEHSEGKVVFKNFKKIDEIESKNDGIEYYGIEFNGNIVYQQDGYATANEFKGGEGSFLSVKKTEPNYAFTINPVYHAPVKKNQEEKINGVIKYVKTENGWKVSSLLMSLENHKDFLSND